MDCPPIKLAVARKLAVLERWSLMKFDSTSDTYLNIRSHSEV